MAKSKRKPAAELVAHSISRQQPSSWYDSLSADDRQYVQEVVQEIVLQPGIALLPVAKKLIAELQLERSAETVAKKLRSLVIIEECRV